MPGVISSGNKPAGGLFRTSPCTEAVGQRRRAPGHPQLFRCLGLAGEDRLTAASDDQPRCHGARRAAIDAGRVYMPKTGRIAVVSMAHLLLSSLRKVTGSPLPEKDMVSPGLSRQ